MTAPEDITQLVNIENPDTQLITDDYSSSIISNVTSIYAADPCSFEPKTVTELVLTVFLGTIMSIISLLENLIIFITLVRKQKYYRSHFLYLLFLAFWDCVTAITFVLLFVVDVVRDWMLWLTLSHVWLTYLPVVYMVSQYATTVSTYFILCATFERFLLEAACQRLVKLLRHARPLVCILTMLSAGLVKCPVIFEVTVRKNDDCEGLRDYYPDRTDILSYNWYFVYSFYIRTLTSDLIPFVLIFVFNFYISYKLRVLTRRATLFRVHTKNQFWLHLAGVLVRRSNEAQQVDTEEIERDEMRMHMACTAREEAFEQQARLAGKMLVVMVGSFLVSKSLNFVLSVWEFVDVASLDALGVLYRYSSQISNLLALSSCASRLPIYLIFNPELRAVIIRDLRKFLSGQCLFGTGCCCAPVQNLTSSSNNAAQFDISSGENRDSSKACHLDAAGNVVVCSKSPSQQGVDGEPSSTTTQNCGCHNMVMMNSGSGKNKNMVQGKNGTLRKNQNCDNKNGVGKGQRASSSDAESDALLRAAEMSTKHYIAVTSSPRRTDVDTFVITMALDKIRASPPKHDDNGEQASSETNSTKENEIRTELTGLTGSSEHDYETQADVHL